MLGSLHLHLAHLHWEYNKCCTTVAVFFQWKVNAERLTCCLQAQAQSRKKKGLQILSDQIKLYFNYFIFYFIYFLNCIYLFFISSIF